MSECSLHDIIETIGGISLNAIFVILKWEMLCHNNGYIILLKRVVVYVWMPFIWYY
jgi:hypothetical protein